MNDLFSPPALARETFAARRLSLVPVRGDGMSPTLRGDWDSVLAAPVDRFHYDSLYVVEQYGQHSIYRCQGHGADFVSMMNDNPRYGATPAERANDVPREWFMSMCSVLWCATSRSETPASCRRHGQEMTSRSPSPVNFRAAIAFQIEAHADVIEMLVALLNAIDGDADFEAETGVDQDVVPITLNSENRMPVKRITARRAG